MKQFTLKLSVALFVTAAIAAQQTSIAYALIPAPTPTIEVPGTPMFDAVIAGASAGAITAANTTMINTGAGPKNAFDALAWAVAKTALQSMTQSTVNWINSGFQGSPGFVTDLQRNLSNLSDQVANDFLNDLTTYAYRTTGINVRSPLQDQVANALRQEFYRTTSSYGFDARYPYTLGSTCSDPTGFTQGKNFNCGLNGWFALSQNPANNPWGRYQLAENELFMRLDTATQQRKSEIQAGRGFLSWRGKCGPNASPNAAKNAQDSAKVSFKGGDPTANCPIRTPGAVIENALGIGVTSPFRQLELADSINEIVVALTQQLVGQVLGGNGLAGLSEPAPGGGASYASQSTAGGVTGAAGAIVTDLNSALTNVAAEQAADDQLIAKYDEGIRKCSIKSPETAREFQDEKASYEKDRTDRAAIVASISSLRDRITAALKDSTASITALVTEYQSLIARPAYSTRADVDATAKTDRLLMDSIDREVSEKCT